MKKRIRELEAELEIKTKQIDLLRDSEMEWTARAEKAEARVLELEGDIRNLIGYMRGLRGGMLMQKGIAAELRDEILKLMRSKPVRRA